jgi:hypothetical protein
MYSSEIEKLMVTYKDSILEAVPFMRKINRKNTVASGFVGSMYAVGLRSGYECIFLDHSKNLVS